MVLFNAEHTANSDKEGSDLLWGKMLGALYVNAAHQHIFRIPALMICAVSHNS